MNFNYKPYVSLDIETTGLSDDSHILQIACVLDDSISSVDKLQTLDLVIRYDHYTHAEPYALFLNAKLIEKIAKNEVQTKLPEHAANYLMEFMQKAFQLMKLYDEKAKVVLAGKNVAGFDLPKVKKFMEENLDSDDRFKEFNKLIDFRTLDVGSLFFQEFRKNVSLETINKFVGRTEVSHNALEDALDVVHAIRHKMNNTDHYFKEVK